MTERLMPLILCSFIVINVQKYFGATAFDPKGNKRILKEQIIHAKSNNGIRDAHYFAPYRLLANLRFSNAAIPVDNGYLTAHSHYLNS